MYSHSNSHAHTCTCTYIYTHPHAHIHTCMHTHTHIHTFTHPYTHSHIHAHSHTHTHIHTHTFTHACTLTHTHTPHTHIHTCMHIHTGAELIGESALSQLRARLDPIYNPPPAPSLDVRESSNNEPTEQTGSGRDREGEEGIVTPQEISETGDPHHSHKLSKHKRTRRGRKREEEEERKESEEPLPAPTCIQEGEPQEGMDHGKVDEPHPPPSEPPPQGTYVTLHNSMVTMTQLLTSGIHPFICPHMP